MYILGHVGFTAAAVRALDRERDWRLPALMSILPDVIDKPVAFLFPALVNANTRGFGHTLLGALAVLALLLAARRRLGDPFLLWACYAGHFVLDRLWLNHDPAVALWPFLGPFPPPLVDPVLSRPVLTYNIVCEAVGLALVVYLARRSPRRPTPSADPRS